jgi:hypothetical protein
MLDMVPFTAFRVTTRVTNIVTPRYSTSTVHA